MMTQKREGTGQRMTQLNGNKKKHKVELLNKIVLKDWETGAVRNSVLFYLLDEIGFLGPPHTPSALILMAIIKVTLISSLYFINLLPSSVLTHPTLSQSSENLNLFSNQKFLSPPFSPVLTFRHMPFKLI